MDTNELQNYSPNDASMVGDFSSIIIKDATIIDFLHTHQESFDELLFTPVDSLILSTLAYLNIEEYQYEDTSGSEPVPFIDILRFSPVKKLTSHSWMKDITYIGDFLSAVACSRRYKDLAIMFYFNEYSDKIDKQFSAMTFKLSDHEYYVAYRGTDGTFAGWKEDFNLSFRDVVPSQMTALRYLSGTLSAIPSSACIHIGGHSKGGNLAEFAALTISEKQYRYIRDIYNHDGPSFLNDPSPRIRSEEFRMKLHKTVPESAVFGMVLEDGDHYKVVKSNATFLAQHMPLTWIVDDTDFLYQDSLNKNAVFVDETLQVWLQNSTIEQRQQFVDTFYEMFTNTPANNWKEFQEKLIKNTTAFLVNGAKLDDATKEAIKHIVIRLGKQTGQHAKRKISTILTDKVNSVARTNEEIDR